MDLEMTLELFDRLNAAQAETLRLTDLANQKVYRPLLELARRAFELHFPEGDRPGMWNHYRLRHAKTGPQGDRHLFSIYIDAYGGEGQWIPVEDAEIPEKILIPADWLAMDFHQIERELERLDIEIQAGRQAKTDAELAAEAVADEEGEAWDRAEYERLKAKYGPV